jgi:methionyl aminopeptidase
VVSTVTLKSADELAKMRDAGRLVARTLRAVEKASAVGVSLLELDHLAHRLIVEAGGHPTFLNYHPRFAPSPYPATLCVSVNDVIVHGIPTDYRADDGDLVSIDLAAHVEGWCADAARSYVVGQPTNAATVLIERANAALDAAIAAAQPGARLGDISAAIGRVGRRAGYGIPPDFGGHGIGRQMHEPPGVSNTGYVGTGMSLEPGLVLAIEPMFMLGGVDEYRVDPDGWGLRTVDGKLAVHVEHTVAITEDGPLVLTLPTLPSGPTQ